MLGLIFNPGSTPFLHRKTTESISKYSKNLTHAIPVKSSKNRRKCFLEIQYLEYLPVSEYISEHPFSCNFRRALSKQILAQLVTDALIT